MVKAPLWVTVLSDIGAASLGTTLLTAFMNSLSKKRDQDFEMAKRKMDVLSAALPICSKITLRYA
jgi:hypothetical protein